MSTIFCLDCDRAIELGHNPEVGQRVRCSNCETKFEVINLNPPKLDWVYDGPAIDLNVFEGGWNNSNFPGRRN